ncbi:MAG: AI-2E family transporter [Pseudomonadota bacterium]
MATAISRAKSGGSKSEEKTARPWLAGRLHLDTRDAEPLKNVNAFWRGTTQTATIVMAALAFGLFLFFARALLIPVLCAVAIAMTLGPVNGYLSKRGVPSWLTAFAVIVLIIAGLNIAIVTLAKPISDFTGRLPELAGAVKEKLHILDRPLAALSELQMSLGLGQSDAKVDSGRMIEGAVTGFVTVVTPAAVQFVLQLVLFFGTLFFAIVGRNAFRNYVVSWFATRGARLRILKILNDIEENLSGYLIVVSTINLALGIVATIMAWALGLPSPLLWGALAFALNYVPYIGPGIMYILLFIAGLIAFPTLLGALLPPAIYIAVTLVEGQFLTPMIVGRNVLSVHPLAVFLGIAFWAWLWGPLGAFLAMPILIVGRVALDHLYPREEAELPG